MLFFNLDLEQCVYLIIYHYAHSPSHIHTHTHTLRLQHLLYLMDTQYFSMFVLFIHNMHFTFIFTYLIHFYEVLGKRWLRFLYLPELHFGDKLLFSYICMNNILTVDSYSMPVKLLQIKN